jgi:hypothetical protein
VIVERRIIVGLIVSSEYLRRIAPFWSEDLVEANEMRRIARWCLEHFEKYGAAPDRDIEQVYLDAIRREAVPRAEAELIEGILTSVSDEYGRGEQFNADYLYDQTVAFFRERELAQHSAAVADLTERGRIEDAERLSAGWTPRSWATSRGLDLGTEPGYERVRGAFQEVERPILTYPGALGELLNRHLIRGGFVAFMGPEKRGKTQWLTDVAFRALRQKCNVAFFQAGDMTENQYLRRLSIYLARRSDDPEYCAPHWRPVTDCAENQFDVCNRADRNCDHGVYDPDQYQAYKDEPHKFQRMSVLSDLAAANPGYKPCDAAGCLKHAPCAWLLRVKDKPVLTGEHAERVAREFFERYRRRFRLVTYPSGTLTCDEMQSCLEEWERQDDFVPDVIAVDYADIMSSEEREFRHRQNAVWMGLRATSQRAHALVVTATQTDADSYKADTLKLSNFTEDKRKYSHVTAMFGLNQDPGGREKELGIMRINTILAREGAFNTADVVHVLQHLAAGRPFVESYRAKLRARASQLVETGD